MDQDQVKKLMGLMEDARKLPEDALKLPMPKRFNLDVCQDYFKSFVGNLLPTMDVLINEGFALGDISKRLIEDTAYRDWLNECGISRNAFEQMLLMRRFQINNSPVFTYRESLCKKLDDMEIGKKVPMELFRPPYDTCFIEFGPADKRGDLGYTIYSMDDYFPLEGAYVGFHKKTEGDVLSSHGRSVLSIKDGDDIRCVEIAFTGSPINLDEEKKSVLADMGTYISIYWTDDSQSIEETLDKHFRLFEENNSLPSKMVESLKENIIRLTKALLYLISGNRYQETEEHEERLSRRLDALKNPAKARKLSRQRYKLYDRVVIGPNRPYVPLKERLKGVADRTGVVPHIRRAHWSSRWSGPKKSILKPVEIAATLVNAKGISDEDAALLQKDYDVK